MAEFVRVVRVKEIPFHALDHHAVRVDFFALKVEGGEIFVAA